MRKENYYGARVWTDADDEALIKLVLQGLPQKEISPRIQRSLSAVNARSQEMQRQGRLPNRRRKVWTPEQDAIALRLLQEDAPESRFRAELGRSKINSQLRHKRLLFQSRAEQARETKSLGLGLHVPPEAIADRDRRIKAPRSLTALLCGDPAPGQSALDRRLQDA